MKLKKLLAITLSAVTILALGACGFKNEAEETPESVETIGIYLTYGEDNESYAFVDPETDMVFLAELPLENIKDEKGNSLKLEELKDGDKLQLVGPGIMTASIPPIYAGITEAVKVENGSQEIVDKYLPMIEEVLVTTVDPSMIPECSIEMTQSYGTVTSAIYETTYDWTYTDTDGNEQHTTLTDESATANEPFTMEEAVEEVTIHFSTAPSELKIFFHTESGTEEVFAEKSGSSYQTTLEAGTTYEIHGTWENGTVIYKFNTTMAK